MKRVLANRVRGTLGDVSRSVACIQWLDGSLKGRASWRLFLRIVMPFASHSARQCMRRQHPRLRALPGWTSSRLQCPRLGSTINGRGFPKYHSVGALGFKTGTTDGTSLYIDSDDICPANLTIDSRSLPSKVRRRSTCVEDRILINKSNYDVLRRLDPMAVHR